MASHATTAAAEVKVLEEVVVVVKEEEGNTGGSVDPWTAKGDREAKHLLGIFPEEVWRLILDKVEEPQYLENISNSSPYLRKLLLHKRAEYLFPKVFRILGKRDEKSPQQLVESVSAQWKEVEIFKEHQSLRQVCKSWSEGVLDYYQSHPSHLDPDVLQETGQESWVQELGSREPYWFKVYHRERLNAFQKHFEKSHGTGLLSRNPFIVRFVAFQDNEDARYQNGVRTWAERYRDPQGFWNEISSLLLHYGHHLWHCQIILEDRFPSRVDYYNQLKEWLTLMPNLKTLNLVYLQRREQWPEERVSSYGLKDIENHIAPTPEDLHHLEQNATLNPLPSLNSLQLLRTRGLPTPIFNELIRRNSHLVMLDTSPFNFQRNHQGYDLNSGNLPNLTFLSMEFAATADILELGQLQNPLTTLRLGHLGTTFPYQDWPQIFKLISDKWSDTLTDLSLFFLPPDSQDDPQSFLEIYQSLGLNLGSLKRLKLNLWYWLPVDLVLSVKDTLEDLHVVFKVKTVDEMSTRLESYLDDNGAELRKVKLFEVDLKESNVWKMLGKLRSLTIDNCHLSVTPDGCFTKSRIALICSRRIGGEGSGEEGGDFCVRCLAKKMSFGHGLQPGAQFDDVYE